jgi:cytochrome c oxidase subunit 3
VSANHETGAVAATGLSPQYHLAHHFDTSDQQFESNRMGVWLFLVTEILFFGGLFCAFAVFRSWYFNGFVEAHHQLSKMMGATNTVVLITSSLSMALAVRAAQTSNKKLVNGLLWFTFLCACAFLFIKYLEYHHKFEVGNLPGPYYTYKTLVPTDAAQLADMVRGHLPAVFPDAFASGRSGGLFFAVYFMMTGIHGVHVMIGMGLILWIIRRNKKGHFSSRYYSPVENVGLYWHLVDLVWIYLFPLLYLVG